jgi:hypothetical protein
VAIPGHRAGDQRGRRNAGCSLMSLPTYAAIQDEARRLGAEVRESLINAYGCAELAA